jgi:hypothetical protein
MPRRTAASSTVMVTRSTLRSGVFGRDIVDRSVPSLAR